MLYKQNPRKEKLMPSKPKILICYVNIPGMTAGAKDKSSLWRLCMMECTWYFHNSKCKGSDRLEGQWVSLTELLMLNREQVYYFCSHKLHSLCKKQYLSTLKVVTCFPKHLNYFKARKQADSGGEKASLFGNSSATSEIKYGYNAIRL